MSEKSVRVGFLVFIGLPASGKSTLSKELCMHLSLHNANVQVIHVDYDRLVDMQVHHSRPPVEALSVTSQWRAARKEVVECIKSLVSLVMGASVPCKARPSGDVGGNLLVRQKFHELIMQHLRTDVPQTVLVLDDNMYYKSMRYEYYSMARTFGTGFGEVFVNTPLSIAITRNAARKYDCVSEDVIVNMAAKLEPPDPNSSWEHNSCCLNNDGSQQLSEQITELCRLVTNTLKDAVAPKPVPSSTDSVDADSILSADNIVHRADICLRQLVSSYVKKVKTSTEHFKVQQAAQRANAARQSVLSSLRNGDLYLPSPVNVSLDTDRVVLQPSICQSAETKPALTVDLFQHQLCMLFYHNLNQAA